LASLLPFATTTKLKFTSARVHEPRQQTSESSLPLPPFFFTRNQQIQLKVFADESGRSRIHTFQPLEIGGAQLVDAPGSVRVAVVPAELLQELLLALRHLPPATPQIAISSSEPEQHDQIKLGENLKGAILIGPGIR